MASLFTPAHRPPALPASLKEKYGFGRIGEEPERILRRVSRRGSIRSDAELRVVRDIVSDAPDSLEPEQLALLQGAVDDYELGGRGR
jgi:hypothetical protein